jgi:hypothetical protein
MYWQIVDRARTSIGRTPIIVPQHGGGLSVPMDIGSGQRDTVYKNVTVTVLLE